MLPNDRIDLLFRATIEATEEAVVNAMLADDDGVDRIHVLVVAIASFRVLRKYNRMK